MNQIDYVFINDDLIDIPDQLRSYLNSRHIFYYNEATLIRDLVNHIMEYTYYCIGTEPIKDIDDENLKEHIYFLINGRLVKGNMSFNMSKFITLNKIYELKLLYVIGVGGGNGGRISNFCNIRIYPNESVHHNFPHVHVYKGSQISYNNEIRISLEDLSQVRGDKVKIDKLFNSRQRKILMEVLLNHKDELKEYYFLVQNGASPEPIYLKYNGKVEVFK